MGATPPARPSRRGVLGAGLLGAGLACRASSERAEADELDELFADLTDRSGEWQPIPRAAKLARVERLSGILRAHSIDALVIEPGPTLAYLSDVGWGRSERLFALVVPAVGPCFWVVPAFEVPRAERLIAAAGGPNGDIVAWDEHEYAWEPLASALRERHLERVAVEPGARAFVVQRLAWAYGPDRVAPGWEVVRDLRGVKEAHELDLMRGASELTQAALAAVAERLHAGMSDHDLGAWVERAQERLGLTGTWVLPLLGEGASFPHGEPEGRTLEKGSLVLVDTGGSLHGYQSDVTRTWVHDGAPNAEVERAWSTVREAQQRAFETLRPGAAARDVDRAARTVIERAGYGAGYAAFSHRLGHGIGLEGHEEPYLDGGNELALRPGMTFSDEPGIYLAGRFGVRLEDIVAVTADGADHFGDWQASVRAP